MKHNIKIVTFQRAHNYGAFLQAYALQKKLNDLGNSVEVVDYYNKYVTEKPPVFFVKTNIKWTIKSFIEFMLYHKVLNLRYKKMNSIIEHKLKLTKKITSVTELEKILNNNDIIITGSDQVWNPKITNGIDDVYTLNIKKNKIKKISYAPSVGSVINIQNIDNKFINNISQIDSISVREKSTEIYLSEKLPNKNIKTVLDPTLLLSREEWEESVFDTEIKIKEKYILAYVVEPNAEYIKVVDELSDKTGLKIVHFGKNKPYKNILKSFYTNGPFDFIKLIKNAEYIVTTSFHATVFSIIFGKRFWVVPHTSTGRRVIDLLETLNISNRVIYSITEFRNRKYDEEINYNNVNKRLRKQQEESINWLKESLEK